MQLVVAADPLVHLLGEETALPFCSYKTKAPLIQKGRARNADFVCIFVVVVVETRSWVPFSDT